MNKLINFLPSIYIGIAKNQTIAQRLEQHRNNFESKKKGTFGGRVAKYVKDWSYLEFNSIDIIPGNNNDLEVVEKIIHRLTKPVYSKR